MSSQSAATLRSRYVEQAASDLEANRRLQEELAKRIELLKQEEALLSDILDLAERYEGFTDASRLLPEQAQGEPVVVKAKHRGKAGAPKQRSASGKSKSAPAGARAKSGGAKGKSREPLLGDLLMDLLKGHEEPRLAKELRDELLEKHPTRAPSPQVVRNTLEALVAKGRVQRHKQQRSVMYTLTQSENAG
ncbi:BlaI/MecI/CopY family transcriptional regulator [Streptomyces sp. NPDC018584]|uniref:BlaI/MecI/CopY family transcriptional regulator n=1 Tax=unclassified Streptomyces TaxID=2593676 RepID=UPI0037B58D7B